MSKLYDDNYEQVACITIPDDEAGTASSELLEAIAALHRGLRDSYNQHELVDGKTEPRKIEVQVQSGRIYFFRMRYKWEKDAALKAVQEGQENSAKLKAERERKEQEMADMLDISVEDYRAALKKQRGW